MLRSLLGFYKAVLETQIAVVHNSKVFINFVILIIICISVAFSINLNDKLLFIIWTNQLKSMEESCVEKDIEILKTIPKGYENNLNQVYVYTNNKIKK